MATQNDLMSVIKTLVGAIEKITMSYNVIQSIAEDFKSLTTDVKSIAECMSDRKEMLSGEKDGVRSIDSETNAEISDRVMNTERKLVSMEETMNKLMLSMENATQNSKVEEKSNYAFDAIFKGKEIKLSNDQRTASRLRRNAKNRFYGGVLSNIPLRDDVAFEVRIDETIDKWRNFSIALGVIVKKDEAVKEKKNICLHVKGTYAIRSYYNSEEGKSATFKDFNEISRNGYNLDTRDLPVGTTVGIVRRSNNALHFLLNGIDSGIAFEDVPDEVYAFVDVIRYVSKVSVIS